MSQILSSKIATVRRKHAVVATSTGLTAAIGATVLCLAIGMMLDWWLNLSVTWRAAFLAIDLAVLVWILLYAILGPILYGPDEDEIALMVEDSEPAFRTRLIASVQLSRPNAIPAGASKALANAMIAQAESLAGPMDFARVIKTDSLVKIVIISLLILIAGFGSYAWGGDTSRDLLKRAFLSNTPVPRKTRVLAITTDLRVARGDSVELLALADGIIPETGRAYIKTEGGRKQDFILDRVKIDPVKLDLMLQTIGDPKRDPEDAKKVAAKLNYLKDTAPVFGVNIENVQESFSYYVKLNDGEGQEFKVTVLPRPAVTKIEAKQVYPSYTKRGIENRSLGDLALLQGSKLQLSIWVSKTLQDPTERDRTPNIAHLIGSNKDIPLALSPTDPKLLTGEIDLPAGTTGFAIHVTDTDGLKSKDPAVYRIDLVPDKNPLVRIIQPNRKEVLAVRNARQQIIFEATDDFAIGKVALKYKVDDDQMGEQTIPLDLKGATPKNMRGEHLWMLQEVKFTPTPEKPTLEGRVIEYWVEVIDTNDLSGPGKGASEHNMIRIGTEEEVKNAIRARLADLGSTLRNTADDQEGLANKVQTILLEKQQPNQ